MKSENAPNLLDNFYKYGLYIIFALLLVTFSALSSKFFTSTNIINILQQSAASGIAAVGIVFVILTAGIDLSTGTTMYISAVATAFFVNNGGGLFLTIIIALGCGALVGAINGLVIAKWKVVPFIATLATMTFGRGIALALTGQKLIYTNGNAQEIMTKTHVLGIPIITWGFILIMILGQIVLMKTRFGRYLFAIGNNVAAAEKTGIKVKKNLFLVYLISGIMAGLSGFVASAQVGAVTSGFGKNQEFMIISAAVLGGVSLFGGRGNILPGALIGVLIITCIENGLVMVSADPYFYTVVRGLVIFFAVMVDCIRNKRELR